MCCGDPVSAIRCGTTARATDCLTQSYTADRAARVEMLRTMAGTEFYSDAKQAEWHVKQSRDILAESFRPYLDAVAEAIVSGQLDQLAETIAD